MNMIDNDLISIQEARILAENAVMAKKQLAEFSQEKLDRIVEGMLNAVFPYLAELAWMSHEETGYGKVEDKIAKNYFVCEAVRRQIRDMKCVGFIQEEKDLSIMKVGVPLGVITALVPSTSPVSTTIFNAVIAVKAGNAIIFSPHPRAKKTISRTLDILIRAAYDCGMPQHGISYLHTVDREGTKALIAHPEVNVILNTGVPVFLDDIRRSGKTLIYGGSGNGPAFIERTANIRQAVSDVIESKIFDYGMVSAAEQSIVVERCIESEVRRELIAQGAYFMSEEESSRLGVLLYNPDGSVNAEFVGISAQRLAARAGFSVDTGVKVLIAEGKYALSDNPYNREKLCPVLAYYIEDDWKDACEKCIELLFDKNKGHTLVIHSTDEYVIRQFALKKPVARVLVNTPATLGSMGVTTDLFPSMTLGSGVTGQGVTSENVSPMNLVFIRTVGKGIRNSEYIRRHCNEKMEELKEQHKTEREKGSQLLQRLLNDAISSGLEQTR
ncbi:aldehyde dehydrogenase family protein [Fusicatenibacter saccharivorans]|uniref:aldehyde dehydrogenase family protein n=1 Tax=Fusicatenibacter saccharivorans TaxID=1150298 RepID=UPI003CFFDD5A